MSPDFRTYYPVFSDKANAALIGDVDALKVEVDDVNCSRKETPLYS